MPLIENEHSLSIVDKAARVVAGAAAGAVLFKVMDHFLEGDLAQSIYDFKDAILAQPDVY